MYGRRPRESEEIAGSIERITFHDPESGFCVLQVRLRDREDSSALVGRTGSVIVGELIFASGSWIEDRQYGRQFKAEEIRTTPPDTLEGIERYLASGGIKGIRKATARKLIEKFGKDVLDVIENTPKKLHKIRGIGRSRAEQISKAWGEQKADRDIMLFLYSHGVGGVRASQIRKLYGPSAIEIISADPFRLIRDVRGIGFRSADSIASTLGFEKTSMARVRAGVSFALQEASGEGHCALPRTELVAFAGELLGVPAGLIEDAIERELQEGTVIADTIGDIPAIFLAPLHRAERWIARNLRAISGAPASWPRIDPEKAIPWAEKKLKVELSPSQREALRVLLSSKVAVLTGGPGVGKTTLIRSLVTILGAKDVEIALAAPTGRAAKRLMESTGREARTIHRLLEVERMTGKFIRTESNPLECDLLVIDEASMIDVPLMNALVRAVPSSTAIIFAGDVDQLPSVGPGQVLADLIDSSAIPVVRLTEVFRQVATSRIIVNAHKVNKGEVPQLSREAEGDFFFAEARGGDDAAAKIVKIVTDRIPQRFGFDPRRDVQVLAPMRRGAAGTIALNTALQNILNPLADRPAIEYLGVRFARGDKVMQIQNDYEKDVYNGDIGIVSMVETEGEKKKLTVDFDGKKVDYTHSDLSDLVLAYATTIHKSQGSEYQAVVVALLNEHHIMLQRKLLYTAMTRGKRLVVIVGERRAIETAVASRDTKRRWSKLREWVEAKG